MRQGIWTTAALIVVFGLPASPAWAKSYDHPSISQEIRLLEDGTLEVTDTRAYEFEGEFHNAHITLPPAPGGEVALDGVDAVDGKPVRNVRTEGQTLRWQYDARNETRRFAIRYRLRGEVTRSLDAALLDRQFLEGEHAPVSEYRFTLTLPRPARLFKIFVITSRGVIGDLDIDPERGTGTVTMSALRADEWVRFRILFDPDEVPGVDQKPAALYTTWLQETSEETQNYRNTTRARFNRQHAPWPTALAPLMAAGALFFSIWCYRLWRSRGVEPLVGDIGRYFREPPEDIPPGAVPYVLDQFNPGRTVAPKALGATFLDFARRGYLTLRERHVDGFLGIGAKDEVDFVIAKEPPSSLPSYESNAWTLLREATSLKTHDDVVTPAELKGFFVKHPTWITEWSSEPRAWYEETHGPLLAGGHVWSMVGMIGSGIGIMCILIALGFFSNNMILLATGFVTGTMAGLFGLICGAALPRWQPEKLLNARKWRAYSRFLTDFSAMESAPAEHYKLWDYHFVYAAALGVAAAYLKNLKRLMVQYPDRFTTPAWIMTNGRLGAVDAAGSLTQVQSNLESLTANLSALESALSTSTSAGGGFSGGGAGGSSGGGGSSGAS
jgi:uncharacterized membrane protein YgcG